MITASSFFSEQVSNCMHNQYLEISKWRKHQKIEFLRGFPLVKEETAKCDLISIWKKKGFLFWMQRCEKMIVFFLYFIEWMIVDRCNNKCVCGKKNTCLFLRSFPKMCHVRDNPSGIRDWRDAMVDMQHFSVAFRFEFLLDS